MCATRRTTLLWNVTRENCIAYVRIQGRNATNLCIINSNFFFLDNLITTTTAKKGRSGNTEHLTFIARSYYTKEQNIFGLCNEFFFLSHIRANIISKTVRRFCFLSKSLYLCSPPEKLYFLRPNPAWCICSEKFMVINKETITTYMWERIKQKK